MSDLVLHFVGKTVKNESRLTFIYITAVST